MLIPIRLGQSQYDNINQMIQLTNRDPIKRRPLHNIKFLLKLTYLLTRLGVDFINIQSTAYTLVDPKSVKKYS